MSRGHSGVPQEKLRSPSNGQQGPELLPRPVGLLQLPLGRTRQPGSTFAAASQGPRARGASEVPCVPDPQKQETITTHCVKLLHPGTVRYRAVNNECTQSAACPRQRIWAFVSAIVFACDASRTLTFPPSSSLSCRGERRPPLLSESLLTPSAPPPGSPRAGPLGLSSLHAPLTGPAYSTLSLVAQSPAKATCPCGQEMVRHRSVEPLSTGWRAAA